MTTETIQSKLNRITDALPRSVLCTDSNPCGAICDYKAGQAKPWVIADDYHQENFATVEEAINAANEWGD